MGLIQFSPCRRTFPIRQLKMKSNLKGKLPSLFFIYLYEDPLFVHLPSLLTKLKDKTLNARPILGDWEPTLKKVMVEPSLTAPYSILVCLAKSSAESMGESILSTVRKAARLAV